MTDLTKIEFGIDINNNETDDLNIKDIFPLNDGLANDNNTDIEDSGVQHRQDD